MKDFLKSIGKSIFNIKDKKQILIPLDEDLIKKHQIEEGLIKKASSMEAQLAKMQADVSKQLEEEKSQELEKEIAKKLNEQKAELDEAKFGNNLSFKRFYSVYFKDKKYRNNLFVKSKNMKKVFGLFDDFRIYNDGLFAITVIDENGKPKIISMGKKLSQVFHEPSSLGEQMRNGLILVPYDEEYNYVPNIDNELTEEVYYDENSQEYKQSRELQVIFKDAIIKREELIREIRDKLEVAESSFLEIKRENDQLKRTNEIQAQQVQVYKMDTTQAMQLSMQYGNAIGEMNRTQAHLQQMVSTNEKVNIGLQKIADSLQKQAEELHVSTHFQRALSDIKGLIEWSKTMVPETINIQAQAEPERKMMAQVGEPLK